MTADLLGTILALFVGLHLVTAVLSAVRYIVPRRRAPGEPARPFITLIRPMCGVDAFDRETLGSSFTQDYPDYEVIFCVASPADPAVALATELIAAHPDVKARLLIGDDPVSGNPKLNNVMKGWRASTAEYVAMTDSNLLLPHDYLAELIDTWRPGTGAVSAPAVGGRPDNFWGAVECAFLNTNQARWQLASDAVGLGYAQGKTLFLKRSVIEAGGGLPALGREMAEDLATTKLVRAQGLRVRLTRRLFEQPVGRRTRGQVWGRQLRWSKIRRDGVPAVFLLEILQGFAAPLVTLLALVGLGAAPPWALIALAVFWYGTEAQLARFADWPMGWRGVAALPVRDAWLPAIWLATFAGRDISWRGTHIPAADTARKD